MLRNSSLLLGSMIALERLSNESSLSWLPFLLKSRRYAPLSLGSTAISLSSTLLSLDLELSLLDERANLRKASAAIVSMPTARPLSIQIGVDGQWVFSSVRSDSNCSMMAGAVNGSGSRWPITPIKRGTTPGSDCNPSARLILCSADCIIGCLEILQWFLAYQSGSLHASYGDNDAVAERLPACSKQ